VAKRMKNNDADYAGLRFTSLRSIAKLVDGHRASVRRWLSDEGIRLVAMGRGRNSAIRYRWNDIDRRLSQREEVD
jgi:hypothetical protein